MYVGANATDLIGKAMLEHAESIRFAKMWAQSYFGFNLKIHRLKGCDKLWAISVTNFENRRRQKLYQ